MLLVICQIACANGEIDFPKPTPLRASRESDDWVKPGRQQLLKSASGSRRPNTMVVQNMEPFAWTLLDDIWLNVWAPNVQVRQDGPYIRFFRNGGGWYVFLKCPTPVSRIPAGGEIEIAFDESL